MTDVNLDTHARKLLDRYTEARTPAADTLAHVRERVGERIAAGDPGVPLEPVAAASGLGWWIGGGVVVAAATAALLLGRGGEERPAAAPAPAAMESVAPSPPALAPPSHQPLPPAEAPAPGPTGVAADENDDDANDDAAAQDDTNDAPGRTRRPRRNADPTGQRGDEPAEAAYDQVKAEMALLGRAQAALQAGDANDALRLLERHARTYPNGYLAEERMLQRMVALCELGKVEAARKAVRQFMKARPSSPLASHAASICKERGGDR